MPAGSVVKRWTCCHDWEEVATVSVMATAVFMSGREKGIEEGEMRESVRVPPTERAMASSRTVSRLLQMLISFSASCARWIASLVSCSCWLHVREICVVTVMIDSRMISVEWPLSHKNHCGGGL